jgi:hypothetical protein
MQTPIPSAVPSPVIHGPFAVDPDGGLTPIRPPALRFAWRGQGVEARIEGDALLIAASAGRVPSTAQAGADRGRAFAVLEELPAILPPGWRLRLLPDHRVRLESAAPMCAPASIVSLVTALVGFALTLDPYLDRLESAGVGPGGVGPGGVGPGGIGKVKTWPG